MCCLILGAYQVLSAEGSRCTLWRLGQHQGRSLCTCVANAARVPPLSHSAIRLIWPQHFELHPSALSEQFCLIAGLLTTLRVDCNSLKTGDYHCPLPPDMCCLYHSTELFHALDPLTVLTPGLTLCVAGAAMCTQSSLGVACGRPLGLSTQTRTKESSCRTATKTASKACGPCRGRRYLHSCLLVAIRSLHY